MGRQRRSKIQQWLKQDLFIFFLPPYSPELNMIEILWRFIKYK
ncbi:MAG: transposase [Tannerellaceae bacterium]|nr:transposase [Tannerellaceae bacterium]